MSRSKKPRISRKSLLLARKSATVSVRVAQRSSALLRVAEGEFGPEDAEVGQAVVGIIAMSMVERTGSGVTEGWGGGQRWARSRASFPFK